MSDDPYDPEERIPSALECAAKPRKPLPRAVLDKGPRKPMKKQENDDDNAEFITEVRVGQIAAVVAERYRVRLSALRSDDRRRKLAYPRQMAMAVARAVTKRSLPEIGAWFGRDHTTVLHAIRAVGERVEDSERWRSEYEDLIAIFKTYQAQKIASLTWETWT